MNTPGFTWDLLGVNGDKLVDHHNAYDYEEHTALMVDILSADLQLGAAPWLLAVQYGRVEESRRMLDETLVVTEKLTKNQASGGHMVEVVWGATMIAEVHHIHGLSRHVQKHFALSNLTFDNAGERLEKLTAPARGILVSAMDTKAPGGGLHSLKRIFWHVKAFCILHLDVPEPKALAWLNSLAGVTNEEFYAISMTMPNYDHGAVFQGYHTVWIALAHERVGLHDGALRFADLQLEPDEMKAGTPLTKWPQVIALACKGRVLAELNRHDEALEAFQAAVTTSKASYSLMEAFALRELANYPGGGAAAIQAGKDLEIKLDTFEGRLTRADFATLKITP